MTERSLAGRILDGDNARAELENLLDEAGMEYETIGWDDYDSSLEIRGVPADHRPTEEVQRVFHASGFATVFVNHVDGWETHFNYKRGEPFAMKDGWRVSYGHRRGEPGGEILIEKPVPSREGVVQARVVEPAALPADGEGVDR